MRIRLCFGTIAVFLLSLIAVYAGAEVTIQNGYVTGSVAIGLASPIMVDMPVPQAVQTVKQYKTELAEISEDAVSASLAVYAKKPAAGDQWELYDSFQWPCTNFFYHEQNGRYAIGIGYYDGPRLNLSDDSSRLINAASLCGTFLDQLGIAYETPFFVCAPFYKLGETSQLPIHSIDDYIRVNSRFMAVDYFRDLDVFEQEADVVLARFLLDGVPLCICDTSNAQQATAVTEDVGASAIFFINKNGEIVSAQMRNYCIVTAEQEDSRTLLDWETCLHSVKNNFSFQNGATGTLVEAELNLCINSNGVTYPVWRFVFNMDNTMMNQKRYGTEEAGKPYTISTICVDAYTGLCY